MNVSYCSISVSSLRKGISIVSKVSGNALDFEFGDSYCLVFLRSILDSIRLFLVEDRQFLSIALIHFINIIFLSMCVSRALVSHLSLALTGIHNIVQVVGQCR